MKRSGKQECLEKTLDRIKTSATHVARRTPDSVTIQEIFDERTAAHNELHRNRGFSPWQLLLGKTPTDKSVFESPDQAQCSVEIVDEAAKQRLRVKEESYKAYIEEELSLRKRRRDIHQARPWRHWAAGDWCWYWRSGKHADTDASSFQDLVRRLPRSTFLDLTTQIDALDDVGKKKSLVGTREAHEIPAVATCFWSHQPDATSRLGPDLVPPSRPVRTDD